jgi:tetratricopeptide (TPR) repeat protein
MFWNSFCRCQNLSSFQERDDLSGWIYAQLQWVAAAPAVRARQLTVAVAGAWRPPRTEEEIQAWQDLLTNEGYDLLLSGDIVRSTDAYTAAYEWARNHPELDDGDVVLENILKPLGNNYTRLGDYEQALFIHQKALNLALACKDKAALAGCYGNLASTCSNMGRPEQSLDYCKKGLAVVDSYSALAGLLLSEQADAFAQLHEVSMAEISIERSIAVLERAINKTKEGAAGYWLLTAYQQAGDLYQDEPRIALADYRRALGLQVKLDRQYGRIRERDRAKLYERLSALYARLGEVSTSISWSDSCLAVLLPGKPVAGLKESDVFAENTLADLLFVRSGVLKATNPDEALRLYELSFAAEKKLRQALITSSSKELAVATDRHRYEEAIDMAWERWENTRDTKYEQAVLRFMESSKAQLLLEEVLRQRQMAGGLTGDSIATRIRLLENALAYYKKAALQYPADDSMVKVYNAQEKQSDWELAQLYKKTGGGRMVGSERSGAVGDGRVFEEGQVGRLFFAGIKAVYVVECTGKGISFIDKLPLGEGWEDSLRVFTDTWFGHGADAMINRPADYYHQAYALYRDLFGTHPFEAGKQYILFPDGAMDLLPVEALVTSADCPASPADWPFVIRHTLLSYGWSLQTMLEQKTNGSGGQSFSGFFLSGGLRSSPMLGSVEAEEQGIRRIIKGDNWYLDSAATTANFRQALANSAVVHISAHAFTKKNGLDIPHIELYDNPFYLFELQGIGRHPALVVLSACRTGDGKMVTGEGVQSMARAFTAGGTNAVVAGWWNVNDETAAKLMEGFYRDLRADGNAAAALQKAKLEWLDDPATPYLQKLPYFWASLGYLGEPSPLRAGAFSRSSNIRWWLLLALAVILLVTAWVYDRGRRSGSRR